MKWRSTTWDWKRRFALLPISCDGHWYWLVWYWRRFCGDCYEVSFAELPPKNEGNGSSINSAKNGGSHDQTPNQ